MPPTRKPCGRFLTLEEVDALLAQLEFRDRLIVRMFCSMGFRPGELFALRRDDVEDARVRVDESWSPWGLREPKTKDSDAYLPMPATVRSEMETWREVHRVASPAALIFPTSTGKPISPHNYERDVIAPAAIRAGIMAKPAEKRPKGSAKRDNATAVNFQAFRRTFATWMQKTGATVKDVRGAMRHSTPDHPRDNSPGGDAARVRYHEVRLPFVAGGGRPVAFLGESATPIADIRDGLGRVDGDAEWSDTGPDFPGGAGGVIDDSQFVVEREGD